MENKTIHCLVFPFPAHGHINPMLQFSKLIQHQGVKVTLVTPLSNYKNLPKVPSSISIETISDGFDQVTTPKSFKHYLSQFWEVGSQSLADLIINLNGRPNNHVDCVIYDSFMPWCLDVAKRFGIIGAAYLTQNLAMNSIYYHVHLGKLKPPFAEQVISLPALPQLQHRDMPSFYFTYEQDPTYLDLVVAQFSNIENADWILCNSFFELEKEVSDWTMKIWSNFRTIGPSIPNTFLDKKIKDDEDYGVSEFKSEESIEWLNNKPKRSVVYVSFGSMAALNEEQIEEVAHCLKDCGSYFLWIVKTSEETKLPKDFEKKSENGLVVAWCPQLKVLAHEAIGCFVTHCGWNSTLEAVSLGVPIVAMPLWSDQGINAKLVVDVWKVGIRGSIDEKEIVRKEALRNCICEIMESDKSTEIMNSVMQWKNLAAKAVSEDGSSYKNMIGFVNSLFHH
ncbi:mogroside IE synthase-like isoform X2 [Vicia villosa]|uniref:mogroside IE synthase-like isoform X2 n=1 Tax=Vicia villosa TaxID=3911 RepID=UPI00273B95F6|nr:mogroside IE synthase-like isoform X2 [Vicia villosa]